LVGISISYLVLDIFFINISSFILLLQELILIIVIVSVDSLLRLVVVENLEFYLLRPLFRLVLLRGTTLSDVRAG
jgi:hypothetical protein